MNKIAFRAGEEAEHVAERLEAAGYTASLRFGYHQGRYCTTLSWRRAIATRAGMASACIWLTDDGQFAAEVAVEWLDDLIENERAMFRTIELALGEVQRLLSEALAQKAAA